MDKIQGEAELESREVNYAAILNRLRGVFKDSEKRLDMNMFLGHLLKRELISTARKIELETMSSQKKIDGTFDSLIESNVQTTYDGLMDIFKEMERDDMIEELQRPVGMSLFKSGIVTSSL